MAKAFWSVKFVCVHNIFVGGGWDLLIDKTNSTKQVIYQLYLFKRILQLHTLEMASSLEYNCKIVFLLHLDLNCRRFIRWRIEYVELVNGWLDSLGLLKRKTMLQLTMETLFVGLLLASFGTALVRPAEVFRPREPLLSIGEPQQPRIKFEAYKALAGETIRLECPQPNPTWFFRRLKGGDSTAAAVDVGGGVGEDLIVTRHGIINADYKYKIMCHITLKHKVIIINNIDFDEEGLYTCLYTQPQSSDQFYANNNDGLLKTNELVTNNNLQYRYVFNVTVYSKFNFNFVI